MLSSFCQNNCYLFLKQQVALRSRSHLLQLEPNSPSQEQQQHPSAAHLHSQGQDRVCLPITGALREGRAQGAHPREAFVLFITPSGTLYSPQSSEKVCSYLMCCYTHYSNQVIVILVSPQP